MTKGRSADIANLMLTNLQRASREYCQALSAILELDFAVSDEQARRTLALLQSTGHETDALIEKFRALMIDSGWLERVSDSKRTDKRERISPEDIAHAPTMAQKKL